jgi:uncharacterized protein YaaW (UPF0174 family)
MQQMSKEEVQELVDKTASKAVKDTLTSLGFDTGNPIDIQRNMLYLDSQRRASEAVAKYTRMAVWGAIVTGIISTLGIGIVQGLKELLGP